MKKENKIWIPKSREIVRYKEKLYWVIGCNLGGKCVIKEFATTSRITKKIKDIDISELQKVKP